MSCWKKSAAPILYFEMVWGWYFSRFRRMRFFSSTKNSLPTRASTRNRQSTLVKKYSLYASLQNRTNKIIAIYNNFVFSLYQNKHEITA